MPQTKNAIARTPKTNSRALIIPTHSRLVSLLAFGILADEPSQFFLERAVAD